MHLASPAQDLHHDIAVLGDLFRLLVGLIQVTQSINRISFIRACFPQKLQRQTNLAARCFDSGQVKGLPMEILGNTVIPLEPVKMTQIVEYHYLVNMITGLREMCLRTQEH